MNKTIITFTQIMGLNRILLNEGLGYKVHLQDACGGQSFTIGPLDDNTNEEKFEEAKQVVIQYFKNIQIELEFLTKEAFIVI
ncbi:hypothetical protein EDD66_103299 [Mobilisporobacter senegalensis]|uniref:Uncharacterized protein n=1 Tax=Mobilisporobacter senegalensis TaxID=1329262 RepID=A0A3N1XW03_9FIRM|nr:hypothetical protein [Mobilisporobacter senegalensis]ROR29362.1 hypothetical protein EDD66_103299 [Mobilisporobacter senegalensis]